MKLRPGIELASLTDLGRQRERNEDSLGYWEAEDEPEFCKKGRLAVIADGMGGHEGGQQASQLAIKTLSSVYRDCNGADPQTALLKGLQAAHEAILDYAARHPGLYGMGTTCTAAAIVGSQLFFSHVGDSRLYLVRGESISRLTRDHSYVGRLVEAGLLRPQDAEHHPQRHVLTAALGVGAELTPDAPPAAIELRCGDILLLCTDGLWGVVSDDELQAKALAGSPEQACRELIALANSRGGPDNLTVQILRVAHRENPGT
jgi:serine/threonine protein phosphatase PrpC